RHYTRIAEEQGPEALWDMLHDRDSASAALIHPNNVRRVVRAFEMLEEGSSYAAQLEHLHSIRQVVPAVLVGLAVDPAVLKVRIARRVDGMVAEGLVEEVASLLGQGLRASITAPQAIGYKEIVPYLDGTATLDESVESIKVATNRYAKRQRTWFRSDPRIHWLDADSGDSEELLYRALELLGKIGLEVA
ncbi:MAG: tRNA (adenosine(37)-N6)-dimethylallyltransferase MiaA, partial [Eggerthellaceae bacterium]|nr:tRNA (adenosine(37)-N6)-dimethylallyltransferase MiaA [Eggerthellaceae bacterium]